MQHTDWDFETNIEEKKHKMVYLDDDDEIVVKDNIKKNNKKILEKKEENFETKENNFVKKEDDDEWAWGNENEKKIENKEKNEIDNGWEDWEENKVNNNNQNNKTKYVGIGSNVKGNLSQNDLNKLKKAKLSNTSFLEMSTEEKTEYLKDVSVDSYNVVSQKTVEYGGVVIDKV
jgi:hypothetical protein